MDFTVGTIVYLLAGMTFTVVVATAIVSFIRIRRKTKNIDENAVLNSMERKLENDQPAERQAEHPWVKTSEAK